MMICWGMQSLRTISFLENLLNGISLNLFSGNMPISTIVSHTNQHFPYVAETRRFQINGVMYCQQNGLNKALRSSCASFSSQSHPD